MSPGDMHLLYQTLLTFYHDCRVNVSIFLHDMIQNTDGTIVLNLDGPVCRNGVVPGKIKYYSEDGSVTGTSSFKSACSGCTPPT